MAHPDRTPSLYSRAVIPSQGPRDAPWALIGGALLGVLGVLSAWSCGRGGSGGEQDERRPETTPEEIAQWTGELEKRGSAWFGFPDPPGAGPLTTYHVALGHEAYRLELRVRAASERVTLGIRGVDRQVGGGGWLAFAEGTWHAGERAPSDAAVSGLSGSVARISWSCLGTKLRSGNDGVARLTFSEDGRGMTALYLGYGEPEVWTKAYARVLDGQEAVARGALKGQIPSTPALAPLAPDGRFAARVRVRSLGGGLLAGALVQLKGHPDTQAITAADGEVTISFLGKQAPRAQVFCAGALGHQNGETVVFSDDVRPGWGTAARTSGPLEIRLERIDLTDHPGYAWQHPAPDGDPEGLMACGTCLKWHYDEWHGSRHARSAHNGHVAYEHQRMQAMAPEAPDDCRGCHQPGDAAREAGGGWQPRGAKASVHCDLCHKVHHVADLRESGVFGSLVLARPDPASTSRPGGIHRVFGPAADVTYAYMGASWNPLYVSSHYCAGCHQGGGRWRDEAYPKLDTFREWRAWGADQGPQATRSCQDCHMPGGTTRAEDGRLMDQLAWDGLHRQPAQVHSHRFKGVDALFAAQALDVKIERRVEGGRLLAEVRVTNVGAGHRVPTGTWSKHVLVGVWARQGASWLRQVEGDRAWTLDGEAPTEALAAGDWRNPGGLVLGVREASERSGALRQPDLWLPWRGDEVVDERLLPGQSRVAHCVFALGGTEEATVVVRVIHRRGELGRGPVETPWRPAPYDEPPEVLWKEVVR